MWSWLVTLWVDLDNIHVHYSNTLINTLRITETHMLNCYYHEWSKAARGCWINHPLAHVLVRRPYSCTYQCVHRVHTVVHLPLLEVRRTRVYTAVLEYCTSGRCKIVDIGTRSCRWILQFWYLFHLLWYKARKCSNVQGEVLFGNSSTYMYSNLGNLFPYPHTILKKKLHFHFSEI